MEDDAKKLEEGRLHNKDDLISEKVNTTSYHNGRGDAIDHDHEDHHEEKNKAAVAAAPLEADQIKGEEQPVLVIKQKSKRVATLDAFRGLTIVVYIHDHDQPFHFQNLKT